MAKRSNRYRWNLVAHKASKILLDRMHELENAPFKQLLTAVERINRIALQTDLMS